MSNIVFSPEALSDLQKTKDYISEELCSEQSAQNTVKKILNHIKTLSVFPESGAPLSSVTCFETDYRFFVCGNYTAFYKYEDNSVYVVRILYNRRDFMRILFEGKNDNTMTDN